MLFSLQIIPVCIRNTSAHDFAYQYLFKLLYIIAHAYDIQYTGEPGELLTRGYSVMKGYWGDEKKTNEVIDKEGWMHTGDMAILDPDGKGG